MFCIATGELVEAWCLHSAWLCHVSEQWGEQRAQIFKRMLHIFYHKRHPLEAVGKLDGVKEAASEAKGVMLALGDGEAAEVALGKKDRRVEKEGS